MPNVIKIWETKPPGTLWATPGLLRDFFTFTLHTHTHTHTHTHKRTHIYIYKTIWKGSRSQTSLAAVDSFFLFVFDDGYT